MMFDVPVSSSSVRKIVPLAVEGFCLTITNPATDAIELSFNLAKSAHVRISLFFNSLFMRTKIEHFIVFLYKKFWIVYLKNSY